MRNHEFHEETIPFLAHMGPELSDTPNLTLIGGWLFVIGSLFYLTQAIISLSKLVSWQNICFICGTILYLAGSCLFTIDSSMGERFSNRIFLRRLRSKSRDLECGRKSVQRK